MCQFASGTKDDCLLSFEQLYPVPSPGQLCAAPRPPTHPLPGLARPSRMVIVCVMSVPHISLTLSVTIVPSCSLASVRNTLFSNRSADLNNTLQPGFLFYPTSFGATLLASDITNDGTGLTITTGPDFSYASLSSAIINNAANKWSGNVVSGGFYIEVDMQFDPSK